MSITATLIGQMITFGLLVWFTMKFVWPPLLQALEERKKKIADGLAAGEKGKQELEQEGQGLLERCQRPSRRHRELGAKAGQ